MVSPTFWGMCFPVIGEMGPTNTVLFVGICGDAKSFTGSQNESKNGKNHNFGILGILTLSVIYRAGWKMNRCIFVLKWGYCHVSLPTG